MPKYRNVHCEFWALAQREPHLVGTSVLFMTPEIDRGDVFFQEQIPPSEAISVYNAVCANAQRAVDCAVKVARLVAADKISRIPQSELSGTPMSCATPTFFDLLKALLLRRPRLL